MDRIENIDYCIRYLLKQSHTQADIPAGLVGKQRLLRALMNIWEPQPLSDEFILAQNAELQAQLTDKGVVKIDNSKLKIEIWQGDITRLRVDAIVNAANSRGLGCWYPLHACIDNAIHSAAGLQLRQECNNILRGGEIANGDAIITPGYNLPSQYVLHTVGPIILDGVPTAEQEAQLANCYRNCLGLAEANGCRSIAFCSISTGEFHFPNRRAAEIAIDVVKEYTTSYALTHSHNNAFTVVFNVFKDIDYAIYRQLLGKD